MIINDILVILTDLSVTLRNDIIDHRRVLRRLSFYEGKSFKGFKEVKIGESS